MAQDKRILVLEDEPRISDVLKVYLQRDGFETTVCVTVQEALAALQRSRPKMMILDLALPDGSGLDVLRAASSIGDRIPAIVLTARGEESDRIVGLELGADDYVVKPFSPRELMARVRALQRRIDERTPSTAAPDATLRIGTMEIDLASHEVKMNGRLVSLTATEFRILGVLASSPGEVFTRAVLLDRLQDSGNIYERTLDRHINNLRKKIEPDSRNPSHVVTVYGVGYKLRRS
ncbi:MAG TPA: response regulator transcription factor [Candidatus Babeliales bacterium]|nr:response regulator transcription factor [Candidatus Babeliales bacterium]